MLNEINRQQAHDLLESGQAGYWSVYANPPTPHPDQVVVVVFGRFYLLPGSEFRITEAARWLITETRGKAVFEICSENDELSEMIRSESMHLRPLCEVIEELRTRGYEIAPELAQCTEGAGPQRHVAYSGKIDPYRP